MESNKKKISIALGAGSLPIIFLCFIMIIISVVGGSSVSGLDHFTRNKDKYNEVIELILDEEKVKINYNELCWYYILLNENPDDIELKHYARWIAYNNPTLEEEVNFFINRHKDELKEYSKDELIRYIESLEYLNSDNDYNYGLDIDYDNCSIQEALVMTIRSRIGAPYVWGAPSSLTNKGQWSFDCSGLIAWVHYQCGINIGRPTTAELIKMGTEIEPSKIKAGDIVVYRYQKNGKAMGHVVMYVGNGKVVHAPQTGETVKEGNLDTYLKKKNAKVRRLYN